VRKQTALRRGRLRSIDDVEQSSAMAAAQRACATNTTLLRFRMSEERFLIREHVIVAAMRNFLLSCAAIAGLATAAPQLVARAQLPEPGVAQAAPNPLTDSTVKPGKMLLFDLEARFAKDVKEKGGAAFADWFADDGVALGNGAAPLIGKVAIVKSANWSPRDYQLTWTPTDAMMGPSGDMGYTWGHFEGRSKDANGNPVVTSGRYMTMWRKEPDGSWKVVLDAGANDAPEGGACCKLPDR
jgi:ketosteroid isomerase-like protein